MKSGRPGRFVIFLNVELLLSVFPRCISQKPVDSRINIIKQEKQLREEAAAARSKAEEKDRIREEEVKMFEVEFERQEQETRELEAEISKLRMKQQEIEEAEMRKAYELKKESERQKRDKAEKERADLVTECRRLENAKEARQRKLAAQHLNDVRTEALLMRKAERDGGLLSAAGMPQPLQRKKKNKKGVPPVTDEKLKDYLKFVDSIEKEQNKLLVASGWDSRAMQTLEECELTKRQMRNHGRKGYDGTTQKQKHDLEILEKWQQWHVDSDMVLDFAHGPDARGTITEEAAKALLYDDKLEKRSWVAKAKAAHTQPYSQMASVLPNTPPRVSHNEQSYLSTAMDSVRRSLVDSPY